MKIYFIIMPLEACHNFRVVYFYIYYEIVHEAHKKENKVINLTITQDCK